MSTRQLAGLLHPAGPVGSLPSDEAAWDVLLATAARYRLLPALWSSVRTAGLVDEVPPALRAAAARRLPPGRQLPAVVLAEAHAANAARVADLLAQADRVAVALLDAGVAFVPLKGLDALWSRRYPDPAARTLTDLDLLVARPDLASAAAAVVSLGYQPADAPPADHHHPPLVLPGHPGSVELHHAVLRGRWSELLPVDRLLGAARPGSPWPMLHPDHAAAVRIAHAELQDEGRVLLDLPLRALHETALGSGARSDPLGAPDWSVVAGLFAAAGAVAALTEHLHLTEVLFGVPAPLPAGSRTRTHAALRLALADRPLPQRIAGQVAFLPRSFSADRMVALHGGPGHGPGLWATRARHAVHGAARRLRA